MTPARDPDIFQQKEHLIFEMFEKLIFVLVEVAWGGLRPLTNFKHLRKRVDRLFDGFWKNVKNEFGKRFIYIGLETSVVVAAGVVEGPSRCSLKGLKASMFIKPMRNTLFSPTPRRARPSDLHQPLMRQNPIEQVLFGEKRRRTVKIMVISERSLFGANLGGQFKFLNNVIYIYIYI